MDEEVWEALQVIKHNKAHVEAIKFLSQDMQLLIHRLDHVAAVRASSLRAIKKINRGKSKDIDTLCEPDLRDDFERWRNK